MNANSKSDECSPILYIIYEDGVVGPIIQQLSVERKGLTVNDMINSIGVVQDRQGCVKLWKYYFQHQNGISPLIDGRYATVPIAGAIPVELYHPAFAQFLGIVGDKEFHPPEALVRSTVRFLSNVSQIATSENSRQQSTRNMLAELLGHPVFQTVHRNGSSADHVIQYQCAGGSIVGSAALAVIEEKAELGTSGEPSVQGSFSYLQHFKYEKALKSACFCPSFIIALAGPWVTILGAIFTSRPIFQRLTDYIWLGGGRVIDDGHVMKVAKIFAALKESMNHLSDYYKQISKSAPDKMPSKFMPLAQSCIVDDKTITWTYLMQLKDGDPASVVFLATNSVDQQKLVIKFVERYGESAHRALMASNRAPELLYCGDVWASDSVANRGCDPRRMVVMKYVHGKTLAAYPQKVPEKVRSVVRELVEELHQLGLVHGDIRRPNVIIEEGAGSEETRVRLLDFDWSGKEGEVRYPLHLTKNLWAEGVEDYKPILASHDLQMVEKL
ncbi:hypothetical protein HYPSUDRAFT_72261 [Hypholoma sublateritium FD-334 SS-4]|uniref:Protein kinase domain-containing protein n=1 Tax=Hypholoma sublateritium (strain FD-334 SS-4) TaxID=945553 RepID=A0A0D2KKB5_HYPSF|nr:hypothetical protein HYPSUDRAFT_72261 [Hypholoma sublateritium FD-334 SS-4]